MYGWYPVPSIESEPLCVSVCVFVVLITSMCQKCCLLKATQVPGCLKLVASCLMSVDGGCLPVDGLTAAAAVGNPRPIGTTFVLFG